MQRIKVSFNYKKHRHKKYSDSLNLRLTKLSHDHHSTETLEHLNLPHSTKPR